MTSAGKWILVRIVITAFYLFGGWLLFTGTLALRSLVLGALFSVFAAVATYHLFIDESETQRRSLVPRLDLLVFFILFVMFRMYTASFKVLYLVIRGRINPRIVHFRTRLRSDMARVVLTNAITMTPGTIALNLDDDHLVVHWLDAHTTHAGHAGEVIKGRFERILAKVWV